jgi:Plasmid encoded RepA protein
MTNHKQRGEGGLVRVGDFLPEILPAGLFDEVIRPEDVGYTHPVFLQCFMPTRHSDRNQQQWQTNCGRASLVFRAGVLIKPGEPHTLKNCIVPAGPKARLVNAYVNDFILCHRTPTVDLGSSLRETMQRMNISIGGKNGKLLHREVENFAAAEIILGVWGEDGSAYQEQAKIARRLSFWIEKNPDQRTIWQPEMIVSSEYYQAITQDDRLAPFYWPALVALQNDTRAMDIHSFLVYRLRKGLKRPVPLHAKVLHAMFGRDIKQLKHFWPRFKQSLANAHKWYPKAQIEVKNDCIILKDSLPLIPYRKMPRLGHIER